MATGADRLELLRQGKLAGCAELDLTGLGLSEFPLEVLALAPSLVKLDLSRNALSALPDEIASLTNLEILFCSSNHFAVFPAAIAACPRLSTVAFKQNKMSRIPKGALSPSLRWLILTDNQINALPEDIGVCTRLEKLMLAGNSLTRLPDSLARCSKLALLRISANKFSHFPRVLGELPNLTWLAFAGNAFSNDQADRLLRQEGFDVPPIQWNNMELHEKLGEGASGVIYRANWSKSEGEVIKTAVKLFKGAVTSDGLPHNEMQASLLSASHSHTNLIPILGQIVGHPQSAEGLVFALIAPTYTNLAGPPSMTTCTRDVYPEGTAFSPEATLACVQGIAAAASHLHARGIAHGDLYAHNILIDAATGHALLGDFGAASPFDPTDDGICGTVVRRAEARALGFLIEEMLLLTTTEAGPLVEGMRAARTLCDKAGVSSNEIAMALGRLA
ncbi:hypothetical protein HDU87_006478 [Geranomyces variabilis]|uniref:Protein kinase domain-containing protein n=1 Tax=Geranomyces variabilis TaxID=109894 RepID=A0AAD5XKD4_9FUNG|nr:hypothetical protein HDU87_006478 [Geranomyces variabilis]